MSKVDPDIRGAELHATEFFSNLKWLKCPICGGQPKFFVRGRKPKKKKKRPNIQIHVEIQCEKHHIHAMTGKEDFFFRATVHVHPEFKHKNNLHHAATKLKKKYDRLFERCFVNKLMGVAVTVDRPYDRQYG